MEASPLLVLLQHVSICSQPDVPLTERVSCCVPQPSSDSLSPETFLDHVQREISRVFIQLGRAAEPHHPPLFCGGGPSTSATKSDSGSIDIHVSKSSELTGRPIA
ncbi:hypothetical protein CDAR_543971 [Caerostris darwini]|uniref:Uncharacterized protein n=1 Tax=Caerostris darwini TaxID=1538125 RepID=A0AAV4TKM3_9ARAC|nr:hypothetical protein CDAR_543971 [Caerostris darwini]